MKQRAGLDPVCAVAAAARAREMAAQVRQALRHTHTVELRLDWLRDERERTRLFAWLRRARPAASLIATCRRRAAGGRFAGGIEAEQRVLEEAVRSGCGWYDIEIESVEEAGGLQPIGKEVARGIVSLHRFGRWEHDPRRLLSRFRLAPGTIWKLAVECRDLRQSLRLIRQAEQARRASGMIVIPMGRTAQPARILALGRGSLLTYAAVSESTAPGQPTLETMVREYRAQRIDRRTRVYGIIGDRTGHSISPAMHNTAFAANGINAIYLPFPVEDLKDFLAVIEPFGIRGFSVTIPHKQAILAQLDYCDPLARRLGAVNTVVVRGHKLHGYNTDYAGVLAALRGRVRLEGCRALLVGAGGAARAGAFALSDSGAQVFVLARRSGRGRELARAAGGEMVTREELRRRSFDLIVNATPAGMAPDRSSPLAANEINAAAVFDMVYRPMETPLLRMAARRGAKPISGVEMLVAQGAEQWRLWTGRQAPVRLMRRAALEALGRGGGKS